MSAEPSETNPYRSPLSEESALGERRYRPNAELVSAGWLLRHVRLLGPVDAVIEYSGRPVGYDVIRINGRVVQRRIKWWWWVQHFSFDLATSEGIVPVRVDLQVDLLTRISRFAISAGDYILYQEPTPGAAVNEPS